MGTFTAEQADNYGGNGGSSFFTLKNDKDTARVRFMYGPRDKVVGYAVHEVKINDKRRYVNCIRNYDEPISNCPFCAAKMQQIAKLFLPLYNEDAQQVQIWERGKKFFGDISGIMSRYGDNPNGLVSQVVDIERHGKKGDTSTTYSIFPVSSDDTMLEDLPEVPSIIGGIVLDKSADEMEYFLEEGDFPGGSGGNSNSRDEYVSRRDMRDRDRGETRRTPARTDREDKF